MLIELQSRVLTDIFKNGQSRYGTAHLFCKVCDFLIFRSVNSSWSGIVLESHISSYNVLKHPYEATFDRINISELLKSSYKFAMKCRKFCRNFVVKLSQPKFTLKIRKTF